MAISPTAGTTANSAGSQATSQAVTVPAGILGGDVVLVHAEQVVLTATVPTLSIASTGTAPSQAGSTTGGTEPLPAGVAGAVYWFTAAGTAGSASSDVGKVVTVSSSASGFWALALEGYSGVNTVSPFDIVPAGAFGGANTASAVCPVIALGVTGATAVFMGGGAAEGGGLTVPSTQRQNVTSSSDVAAAISDSNGSAGSSGTNVGGGSFTTSSATNSVLTAFTMSLVPAGVVVPPVPVLPSLVPPGRQSPMAFPFAAPPPPTSPVPSSSSHPAAATLSGTGSLTAAPQKAMAAAAALSGSGTLTSAGTDVPVFSAVFGSTDGNGVQTWTVTSALNGPSTSVLRILPPSSGSGSYPHSFTFMLPVSTGTDATFGDPLSVMESLGACNAYNTTAVVPSFPIQPWYADNPGNLQQSQESFMLALAQWMSTSSFASGGEKNYLIGFSKSGIGGQGLQFHRPDVWAATASWDAPFMMTDYDGTDPTNGGTVGGNSATCYGTSANFKTNYELSAAHLTTWAAAGSLTTRRRLWIGGYFSFQPDVNAYMTRLTSAGILFDGSHNTVDSSHAWHNGWVGDALTSIMTDPQFASAAALSGSGSLTAGAQVTQPAAASLSGSGSLTSAGLVTQPAAASLSGTGSLTATVAVQFAAASVLAGSGTLAAAGVVTQPAAAALSGSGTLAVAAAVQFAEACALSGTGALTAAASVQFTSSAALSGSGSLTAAGTVSGLAQGSASLSGSGSLAAAAAVALRQAVALAGSGTMTAAALVTAPGAAALSGFGTLSAAVAVTFPASAALSGTGSLAAAVAIRVPAGAALSGSGSLAVSVHVTSPVTEPPVTWSAQPAAPRWTAVPAATRWRVVMALFPPIAAISLEEVNVTWQSNLAGTSVDPTGQTAGQPALPVFFAFPSTSGNYAEPAQPATWYAATWLIGGTSAGFISQCLVGPGGGVVMLAAGQAFDVWARVSGNPEAPAKFVGVQSTY